MNHFLAYRVGDFGGSASNDANLLPQDGHVPRWASWTPNSTVVGSIPTPSAILARSLAGPRSASFRYGQSFGVVWGPIEDRKCIKSQF